MEIANQMNDNIIYFCPNKFENPWIESSSYDCWSAFMIAVLGSLISIDSNADIKPSLLESIEDVEGVQILFL